MAVGFGLLKLSSEAFWRMTPRELASVLGPRIATAGPLPSRSEFERLMARFPDSSAIGEPLGHRRSPNDPQ
ncbi:rcc01693 family protein [Jiella marina]|nr:phage tail assembly chaperone [Jiella sp. LLJ827]